MAAHEPLSKKDPAKWRLALACAVATGVSERLAYDVLVNEDAPIKGQKREKAFRWYVSKRVLVRKERTRPPRTSSEAKPAVKAFRDYVAEIEKLEKSAPGSLCADEVERPRQFRTEALSSRERALTAAHAAVEAGGGDRLPAEARVKLFDSAYRTALAGYQAEASRVFDRIVETERTKEQS